MNCLPSLISGKKLKAALVDRGACGKKIAPQSNYCPNCGAKAKIN